MRSMRSAGHAPCPIAVYAALVEEPLVGRTEADVARWIGRAFLDHGTEGLSFDPIVASGINGSRPHAGATGTVIPEGRSSRSTSAPSSTATAPTARGRSRRESCPPS